MKRICISPCLLGVPCRYDGTSKPCDIARFGEEVEWIPFCPEMAAGLGCPREPIELVENALGPARIVRVSSREDVTAPLRRACEQKADELAASGIVDGFLLKARSPSCGLASPLHDEAGNVIGTAPGEWARILLERFPSACFMDESWGEKL